MSLPADLKATDGQVKAAFKGYTARKNCENGIAPVKKNAHEAEIVEE